jgi:hypothetical protein
LTAAVLGGAGTAAEPPGVGRPDWPRTPKLTGIPDPVHAIEGVRAIHARCCRYSAPVLLDRTEPPLVDVLRGIIDGVEATKL